MRCARYILFPAIVIGAIAGIVPRCAAQNAVDKPLRFEVASIRLAPDAATLASQMAPGKPPHVGTRISGDMVDMGAASLMRLICQAYSIPSPDRVTGPDWITDQRFDILAKLPAGVTKEQLPELLQTLLAERFQLTFHRVSKVESAYVLVVGPKGSKLAAAIPDDPEPVPDAKPGRGFGGNSGPAETIGNGPWGTQRVSISNGIAHIDFYGVTTKGLADYLRGRLGRPVVDMTGLEGKYHVVMDLPVNGTSAAGAAGDSSGDLPASVFASLDKLGLKVESRKVPLEQFVVDHIEKMPTEN